MNYLIPIVLSLTILGCSVPLIQVVLENQSTTRVGTALDTDESPISQDSVRTSSRSREHGTSLNLKRD